MSSIQIKTATIDDLDAVSELFDQYRQFYKQPDEFEASRNFIKERMLQQESVIFYATLEEQAAGFAQLYPYFTSVGVQRKWLLNDLYVAASARRHGVARRLMERAKQHALDTHAASLSLQTEVGNKNAQALYESMGFVREQDYYSYELDLRTTP